MVDVNTDEEVLDFVSRYQTCQLPPVKEEKLRKLVSSLQVHSHSTYCRRNGHCRFQFPHPPLDRAIIAREADPSELTAAGEIMKKVFTYINNKEHIYDLIGNEKDEIEDLPQILKALHISENDYYSALSKTKSGTKLILKRSCAECWINFYSKDVIDIWMANMDLKYVDNEYACVVYLTSYMMKAERAMSLTLQAASNESEDSDAKSQLRKIGSVFLSHREVSAQESTYRILGLPLRHVSRSCVFIPAYAEGKRVRFLKPTSVLAAKENDDENIFGMSMIERYAARPDSLDDLCLADFFAWYYPEGGKDDEEASSGAAKKIERNERVKLKNELGTMVKRKKVAVITFPKFKKSTDEEEQYRVKLMLYLPWRDENIDLYAGHNTFRAHYEKVAKKLHENEIKYTIGIDISEEDVDAVANAEHVWDTISPTSEELNSAALDEGIENIRHVDDEDLKANAELLEGRFHTRDSSQAKRFGVESQTEILTPHEYRKKFRQLNAEQRSAVLFNRKWCKKAVIDLKKGQVPRPYNVFLSAPGGYGKSFVIDMIRTDAIRLLRLSGAFDPEDRITLLTAPTGTAAYLISGATMHSALGFTAEEPKYYKGISHDMMATMRASLSKLRLLIIDEISLCGADMLLKIHRRLEDIMGFSSKVDRFASVSVLASGDMYQLGAVGQDKVYGEPSDAMAALHGSIWKEKFSLIELKTPMRQNDRRFVDLLNRVRIAQCTEEDIEILRSREIKPGCSNYPYESLHLFATNAAVDKFNDEMLNRFITDDDICVIRAQDTKAKNQDKSKGKHPRKECLPTELKIGVGAKCYLTTNISTSQGLTNGAAGTCVAIIKKDDQVCHILVEFEGQNIGKEALAESPYKAQYPRAVPIQRVTMSLGRGSKMYRKQFPLHLGFGMTIHKVQGKTVQSCVVSMRGRFMPGQFYVAVSRVKTLEGLHILDFCPRKIRCDPSVEEEMKRMQNHAIETELPDPFDKLSDKKLKMGHLNIRSLKEKAPDLQDDKIVRKLDILSLNETFLTRNEALPDGCFLADMDIFRVDRCAVKGLEDIHHGGVLIAAAKHLKAIEIDFKISNLEVVGIVIQPSENKEGCVYISVYRQADMSFMTFSSLMRQIACTAVQKSSEVIIVGDFNYDCLSGDDKLERFMENMQFKQLVNVSTHDSGSCLDHVYYNGSKSMQSMVLDCYYSDHDLVLIH